MTARRPGIALAAALALAATLALGPDPGAREAAPTVEAALDALDASRVADARAALARLEAEGPADPALALLRSRLAFFEGRYADAVTALEPVPEGSLGPGWEGYRRLARATRDATADFVEARSEHFRLRHAPGPDEALVPLALETLERIHDRVGDALGYRPEGPVIVEVLPTGSAFIACSGIDREAVETTGTIALSKWDRILLTSPRAVARGYPWVDTLNHEYVHFVVSRLSGNQVPVWLQEGLAHFLENRWRGGEPGELSPYEETLLARASRTGEFITFEQMHPSMAYLPSAEASTQAFAQVATVVQHLARVAGMDGIRRAIDEVARGTDPREAISRVAAMPFPAFEEGWRRLLKDRGLREIAEVGLLKAQVVDAPADVDPKDPAGGEEDEILKADRDRAEFSRLGDLLRVRGRFRASLLEYRKAEGASPLHSPALANKIARAQLGAGQYDAARDTLRRSLDLYPQFTATRVALGEAFRGMKDWEGARRELEASLYLNPFDPRVRSWLAQIYEQAGEARLAAREAAALEAIRGGR